ncbi:hypothetical protein ACLKA6_018517 [Drosophila palustris]
MQPMHKNAKRRKTKPKKFKTLAQSCARRRCAIATKLQSTLTSRCCWRQSLPNRHSGSDSACQLLCSRSLSRAFRSVVPTSLSRVLLL